MTTPSDREALRHALAQLPLAPHHAPGAPVDPAAVFTVPTHRSALDPERAIVVGNRGMGKSFWAHALLNPDVRKRVAHEYRFPNLLKTNVAFGFNGSDAIDPVAPTPPMLTGHDPDIVWQAVLARAVAPRVGVILPDTLGNAVSWVTAHPEDYARLLTDADSQLRRQGERMLLLFDALDRLDSDPSTKRRRLQGLLRLALATQSFRALRVKLFVRPDQFEDPRLFEFPDAAKLRNHKVDLFWEPDDLYRLLFHHLNAEPAFRQLEGPVLWDAHGEDIAPLVHALAGEFMGANKKRGRVYTWLPTHLADAHGQISPRTFLTVWRAAAEHGATPPQTPVDHLGLIEGVRKASGDRLAELAEDYPWVRVALEPLRGKEVPIEREALADLWLSAGTFALVVERLQAKDARLVVGPGLANQLRLFLGHDAARDSEDAILLSALRVIGVVEIRGNGKINIPDIFRVEARIHRRGGVKPPRR